MRRPERGMRLRVAAGGWQLHTPPDNAEFVKNMLRLKPMRLSGAAMEALAIIAYRQPVTRPEIEEIRGVDCGGSLKILLDRRLVRILGKRNEVGRPFIYGTTREFLEFFHLADLSQLPTLRDFEQLSKEFGEQIGGDEAPQEGAAPVEGAATAAPAEGTEGASAEAGPPGMPEGEEVPIEGHDELLEELSDAMTRLDSTRKSVVDTLGRKAAEGEAEAMLAAEGEAAPVEAVPGAPTAGADAPAFEVAAPPVESPQTAEAPPKALEGAPAADEVRPDGKA